jgi:hypothetical protein
MICATNWKRRCGDALHRDLVATTSKARPQATPSRIAPDQLAAIRRQIALGIGIGIER